jgi:glycosyltransferase involved in cell wall biosynthesis
MWQIDLLCRSHYYLLEAVSLLMDREPDFASSIDIVLAGVMSDEDQLIIDQSPAREHVQTLGYIDHSAAIREMMAADILFLPMHGIPSGRRARIVPGKTYEYLATGRPLLAAVPDGDAKDFIAAANAGITTEPCDAPMIASAIHALAQEPTEARSIGQEVGQFERRYLTRRLARHLGRL